MMSNIKPSESVAVLVCGYIRNYVRIWIPTSILDIIVEFHGIYDTIFDSNIIAKEKFQLMELICNELNKNIKLKRIYSGIINGFKRVSFHKLCDNKGPTIVLIHNEYDYIYGGYTSISWTGSGKHMIDRNAFLFRLIPNPKIFNQKDGNNGSKAVFHTTDFESDSNDLLGFGAGWDIWVQVDGNINRENGASAGPCTYKFKSGREIAGGYKLFKIKDFEVFQIIQ